VALHIFAYKGPDPDVYVHRSSKGLFGSETKRDFIQEFKDPEEPFILHIDKSKEVKNNKNKGICHGDSKSYKFYDLYMGDTRGRWERDLNLKATGIARVRARINGLKAVAILDSGSNISFISLKESTRLRLPVSILNHLGSVSGYGEQKIDIIGKVKVKLQFTNTITYRCELNVMRSNHIPLLLGCDFLKAAGIYLSLKDGVAMNSDEVEIPLLNKDDTLRTNYMMGLRDHRNLSLLGKEIIKLSFQLPKHGAFYFGEVRNTQGYRTKLVRLTSRRAYFEVKNISNEAITISPGTDFVRIFVSLEELKEDSNIWDQLLVEPRFK